MVPRVPPTTWRGQGVAAGRCCSPRGWPVMVAPHILLTGIFTCCCDGSSKHSSYQTQGFLALLCYLFKKFVSQPMCSPCKGCVLLWTGNAVFLHPSTFMIIRLKFFIRSAGMKVGVRVSPKAGKLNLSSRCCSSELALCW